MKTTTLTEQLRPQNFQQLSEEKKKLLAPLLKIKDALPHLIFYGLPGTGKTTCARNLAHKICGELTTFNYLQLNASVERGVNDIREKVLKFVKTRAFLNLSTGSKNYKFVFFDEADSLTHDAQTALRNIMESYALNVRFIFSANNVNKLIDAIQSRCVMINFPTLKNEEIFLSLKNAVLKKKISFTIDECKKAAENSDGDLRKAIHNLQILSLPPKVEILQKIKSENFAEIIYNSVVASKVECKQYYSNIVESITEKIVSSLLPSIEKYKFLDRLARTEHAIVSGANPYTQLLGFASYISLSL